MSFARDYARALISTPEGRQRVREMAEAHAAAAHTQEQREVAAGLLRDIEDMEKRNGAATD